MRDKLLKKSASYGRMCLIEKSNYDSIYNEYMEINSILTKLDIKIEHISNSITSAENHIRSPGKSYLDLSLLNVSMSYIGEQHKQLKVDSEQRDKLNKLKDDILQQMHQSKVKLNKLEEKHKASQQEITKYMEIVQSNDTDEMWTRRA